MLKSFLSTLTQDYSYTFIHIYIHIYVYIYIYLTQISSIAEFKARYFVTYALFVVKMYQINKILCSHPAKVKSETQY